jgi:hypothetical protein
MGVIRLGDKQKDEKALLSPQFSLVVSNVMVDMKIIDDNRDEAMKLMYYSLLIYMNEYLKVSKSLMMAFGNDLEKNRENMECGEIVNTYVTILTEIWVQNRKKHR